MIEMGIMAEFSTRKIPTHYLVDESKATIKTAEAPQKLKLITILSSMMFFGAMHVLATVVFGLEKCKRVCV